MIREVLTGNEERFNELFTDDNSILLKDGGKGIFLEWEEADISGIAGVCALFATGRTAMLESISVAEQHRNKGIGTSFVLDLMFELYDRGYSSMSFRMMPSQSEALFKIAKKLHMNITETDEAYFKLKLSDLDKLERNISDIKDLKRIRKLSDAEKNELGSLIAENEFCPFMNPVSSPFLEKDISLIHYTNDEPDGAIFFDKAGDELYLSFLWADSENTLITRDLLSAAYHVIEEKYTKDAKIEVASVTENVTKFVKSLAPDKGESLYEIEADLRELEEFLVEEDDPELLYNIDLTQIEYDE